MESIEWVIQLVWATYNKQRSRDFWFLFSVAFFIKFTYKLLFTKFTILGWPNFVMTHLTSFILFFIIIGIKASSVTAEPVSCVVTSMDFFDRLQEQGLKLNWNFWRDSIVGEVDLIQRIFCGKGDGYDSSLKQHISIQ